MSRVDDLVSNYKRHLSVKVQSGLPISQRTWFLVYPPQDERRIMNRVEEFGLATSSADLEWKLVDLSGSFTQWMDTFDPEERDFCLSKPDLVEEYADPGYINFVVSMINNTFSDVPSDIASKTVVALSGLMELFDFIHVSSVIEKIDGSFPGVLAVFFPGEREQNTYKFVGARTGWDYLAVPILSEKQI
jgi:hypothetical protein